MTRIIIILMGLLVVGGCSPTSEEKIDSGQPVVESSGSCTYRWATRSTRRSSKSRRRLPRSRRTGRDVVGS